MSTTPKNTRAVNWACKIESVYGTDPTIATGDIILTGIPEVEHKVDVDGRIIVSKSPSPYADDIGKEWIDWKVPLELKASAVMDQSPEWEPMLLSACFAKTLSAGATITYNLLQFITQPSFAFLSSIGADKWTGFGARSNLEIDLEAGKHGKLNFNGKSLFTAPSSYTLQDGSSLDATRPPVIKNASFSINSFAAVAKKLNINLNNEFEAVEGFNGSNVIIEQRLWKRDPTIKLTYLAPLLSEFNPHTLISAGTVVPFSITCGSAALNKIIISGYGQIQSAKEDCSGGLMYHEATIKLKRYTDAGNDELQLQVVEA
jgi:hypothetical protein